MKFITIMCASLLFVSCGKLKKWVTDVDYTTSHHNNQQWVVTNFTVNLGEAQLPETLEILPRDYGIFRANFKDGVNTLGLDLNITSILNLPYGEGTLPNGENVPIETNGAGMIEIPFGKWNGKAYFAQADDMTLVGVAITIKQLNDINLGETMMFGSYMLGAVEITAGVFVSDEDDQSGLAVFANLGSLWNKSAEFFPGAFVYKEAYVSNRKRRKMYKRIQRILNKEKRIKFINQF